MKKFLDNILSKIVDLFASKRTYYVILTAFCVLYVLVINKLLMSHYFVGAAAAASYGKDFSLYKMMLCIILVITLAYFTSHLFNKNDVASLMLNILFLIYATPLLMSFCVTTHSKSIQFIILFIVYWILVCLISYLFIYNANIRVKSGLFLQKRSYRIIYIVVITLMVAYMISTQSDFHISTQLISGAYQQRAAYKESAPGIWAYFKMACGAFACPTLIAYYIKRNFKLSLFFVFLQILLFSLARDKAYFFLIIIAIIIGVLADKMEGQYNKIYSIIMTGYSLACLLPLLGVATLVLFEVVVRREMFIPSWLNYLYFDFFTEHTPIWWTQDTFFIDKLLTPIYGVTTSKLIDQQYLQGMVGNPNAGMFAEAISRCGYLGIAIYPFIFAIVLRWVNHFSKQSTPEIKLMYAFCLCLLIQNDTVTSTGFVIVISMMSLLTLIFCDRKRDNTILEDL